MRDIFRNKILVRIDPPVSLSSSPFLLVQLSLPVPSFPPSPSPSPSRSVELETLCCKLSRRWRLACFHQSFEIFVIYQRAQSSSAARVVEELIGALQISNVGVEEEVKETSLIAKAVECGLRSVMLDNNWGCVGDNSFVDSTFASSEERDHILALNVSIQLEAGDGLVFLVSPDILRFNRHKILDLVSSKMLQRFDVGEEIILETYNFSTACTILPYLYEGHVIGLSKRAPAGENFERLEELWSFKYGLALPNYYFIDVQLSIGGRMNKQWFPSSFVLQGSGLVSAPQRIRALKAVHALESFTKIAGGCAESRCVNDTSVVHNSAEASMWKDGTSIQSDAGHLQSSFKASRKKENDEAFPDKNTLPDPGKVLLVENSGKRTLNDEIKMSKGDTVDCCKKSRAKQSVDRSDIIAKVADYHARGKLQSLSAADLKSFLAMKKVKVGGKKEELIQRITPLLA